MARTARRTLGAIVVVLTLTGGPRPPAVAAVEPRSPGPGDVCPVCGMVVALHDEWVAQVVFADGSTLFFDGSKDLFRYLLSRDRFAPEKRGSKIEGIFVTGYYELQTIPAKTAFFVVGSDVSGPMGAELVPHPDRAAADEFLRDHGGGEVVRFHEVTRELLETLK